MREKCLGPPGIPLSAASTIVRPTSAGGPEMRNQEIDDLAALRRALGQPMPPKEIWQKPFDCDAAHLHTLARLKPDERADAGDLWHYA
jgi:hypothetical protein